MKNEKPHQLLNLKFGKLTVIKVHHTTRDYKKYFTCKCGCGKSTVVLGVSLKNGNTKSCGCMKGSCLPNNQSTINRLIVKHKKKAEKKGVRYLITPEEVRTLVTSNCNICGTEPAINSSRKPHVHKFVHNDLSLINPTNGYVDGNVIPVCKSCYTLKGKKSRDEFISYIRSIRAPLKTHTTVNNDANKERGRYE